MNCLQTARAWGYPYDYLRQKREAKAATPKKRQRSHDNLRDRRPTSASEKPLEMRLNRMSHYDLEGNDTGMKSPPRPKTSESWVSSSPTPIKIPDHWNLPTLTREKGFEMWRNNSVPSIWSMEIWTKYPPGWSMRRALREVGVEELEENEYRDGESVCRALLSRGIPWRQITKISSKEAVFEQMKPVCGRPFKDLCICSDCFDEAEKRDKRKNIFDKNSLNRLGSLKRKPRLGSGGSTGGGAFQGKKDQPPKSSDRVIMRSRRRGEIAAGFKFLKNFKKVLSVKIAEDKDQKGVEDHDQTNIKSPENQSGEGDNSLGHDTLTNAFEKFAIEDQGDHELKKSQFHDVVHSMGHRLLDLLDEQEILQDAQYETISYDEFLTIYSSYEEAEEVKVQKLFQQLISEGAETVHVEKLWDCLLPYGFFASQKAITFILDRDVFTEPDLSFDDFYSVIIYFSFSTGFSPDEMENCRLAFTRFDNLKQGIIQKSLVPDMVRWLGFHSLNLDTNEIFKDYADNLDFDDFLRSVQSYRLAEWNEVNRIFAEADERGDNVLSTEEMRNLIKVRLRCNVAEDKLHELVPKGGFFTKIDLREIFHELNNVTSGFSKQEKNYWTDIFDKFAGEDRNLDVAECARLTRFLGFHFTRSELEEKIHRVDVDLSGSLSNGEFLVLVSIFHEEEKLWLLQNWKKFVKMDMDARESEASGEESPPESSDSEFEEVAKYTIPVSYFLSMLEERVAEHVPQIIPKRLTKKEFFDLHATVKKLAQEAFRGTACFRKTELLLIDQGFDAFRGLNPGIPLKQLPRVISFLIPEIGAFSFEKRAEVSSICQHCLKFESDTEIARRPKQTTFLPGQDPSGKILYLTGFYHLIRYAYDDCEEQIIMKEQKVVEESGYGMKEVSDLREMFLSRSEVSVERALIYEVNLISLEQVTDIIEAVSKGQLEGRAPDPTLSERACSVIVHALKEGTIHTTAVESMDETHPHDIGPYLEFDQFLRLMHMIDLNKQNQEEKAE